MKKRMVVLTGAGISAESGISTFRDQGGLWDNYPVEQVCTPEGWAANPNLVTDFYNERREQLLRAEPNEAHKLLALMEQDFDIDIVTQNVDDLHERAGSTRVLHLHGELMKVSSSRDKERYVRKLSKKEVMVPHGTLAPDGSLLRPWIVWFGEPVPNMEPAVRLASKADILVVIGTSLNVYPAAGLVDYAPDEAELYLVDPKPVQVRGHRDVRFIQEKATTGVAQLREMLVP